MEHVIRFDISKLPTMLYADYGCCRKPMLHVDRIADHEILLLVLSGCIPVVEEGQEYFLKSGDLFFLKAGVHHWGRTPFDKDTSWFFIHFGQDTPSEEIPELSVDFRRTKNVHCAKEDYQRVLTLPKHLHNVKNTDIEDKVRKLVELFNSDTPYLMAYVNACLHELLTDIYVQKHTTQAPDSTAARIQRIYHFLSENVEHPFSSADIEAHMNLSFKHIGKLFKEQTGMTLHQCHTKLKMERAARLLCSTDMTVTEISESLGYANPLYFSNVVKKYTSLSPRAYRNKYSSML